MFGSASDPSSGATPQQSTGSVDPRKKRMIDQIMANRQQANQQRQLGQMGGPQFLDYMDQMRMNPFNTWY
jgi:hypothetical protein